MLLLGHIIVNFVWEFFRNAIVKFVRTSCAVIFFISKKSRYEWSFFIKVPTIHFLENLGALNLGYFLSLSRILVDFISSMRRLSFEDFWVTEFFGIVLVKPNYYSYYSSSYYYYRDQSTRMRQESDYNKWVYRVILFENQR